MSVFIKFEKKQHYFWETLQYFGTHSYDYCNYSRNTFVTIILDPHLENYHFCTTFIILAQVSDAHREVQRSILKRPSLLQQENRGQTNSWDQALIWRKKIEARYSSFEGPVARLNGPVRTPRAF